MANLLVVVPLLIIFPHWLFGDWWCFMISVADVMKRFADVDPNRRIEMYVCAYSPSLFP
jgi:hypothetical protein